MSDESSAAKPQSADAGTQPETRATCPARARRFNPKQRAEILAAYMRGDTYETLEAQYGVTDDTIRRWREEEREVILAYARAARQATLADVVRARSLLIRRILKTADTVSADTAAKVLERVNEMLREALSDAPASGPAATCDAGAEADLARAVRQFLDTTTTGTKSVVPS